MPDLTEDEKFIQREREKIDMVFKPKNVVETEHEFVKESKAEFKKAWARDRVQIKERFEIGGRRLTYAQWLVIENCYKVGFYSGLGVKIEFVENNG